MSDNGNNFPEIPFGNRDDANGMASKALQQWAEQFYAKMVEEKQAETADTLVDTLDKAYTVTEKACDSIIDSLDELEKWIDKW